MPGVLGEHIGLPEVWMHFDLVDGRHDRHLGEQAIHVIRHEVADTDRAHLPIR